MAPQQAAVLSFQFVPFLAFVPIPPYSHSCVGPDLLLGYVPVVYRRGGGGSLEGPAKGKKAVLGVKIFWGLALPRRTGVVGLALTSRTRVGGFGADEAHGGGGGVGANEAHGRGGVWRKGGGGGGWR